MPLPFSVVLPVVAVGATLVIVAVVVKPMLSDWIDKQRLKRKMRRPHMEEVPLAAYSTSYAVFSPSPTRNARHRRAAADEMAKSGDGVMLVEAESRSQSGSTSGSADDDNVPLSELFHPSTSHPISPNSTTATLSLFSVLDTSSDSSGAGSISTQPLFTSTARAELEEERPRSLMDAQEQSPTASTSLFGSTTPTTPSLFGAKPAPTAPSLFGLNPASSAAATPGLFGASAAAPKPAFSFGAPLAGTSAPPAQGGLFGGSLQGQGTQPALGLGGFGGGAGAATGLGGSLFAPAQQQQQQQQQVGLQPQQPALSRSTKFNELPDAHRSVIEGIDSFIRSQIQICDDLKTRDLGGEISKTSSLYEEYAAEAVAVSNLLSQDSRLVSELRTRLETDLADLAKATATIEGFKNPQAKGAAAKAVANFPFEFFSRKAEEFKDRLANYKSTMDQIQHQVDSTHGLSLNPSAIIPTLRAQHASFMALASGVAALDSQLKHLKQEYVQIWREKTGSVQDPFFVAKGRDLRDGMEAMNISIPR